MPHTREFRIIATVESSEGNEIRHNEIRRSIFDADLVSDLDRFWRITRELAEINHAIARLRFYRDGRARPVCMREPAIDPSELAEHDRAASILEALRKLTHD